MPGEFEKLLPFKWRETEVPVSRIRLALAHDLVEHTYWGVDGARVEDTGLAPLRISADIPLLNTIYPGPAETWKPGTLYPTALRALMIDFAKKTSGLLQHPEFGRILCKAENMEVELSADRRGHAQVTASWVSTIDDDAVGVPRLSPLDAMAQAAEDIDGSDEDLRALAPTLPEYKASFADLVNALTSISDQAAIGPQRALGRIDTIVYRAQILQRSIDKARNAQTWPAAHAVQRIMEASYAIRDQLADQKKSLVVFTLPKSSTLAGAILLMPESTGMTDVIRLNPGLLAKPVIPEGALLRYYVAA